MKTIFFGADVFALPILNALDSDDSVDIISIVTRPAKPAGRGLKPEPNPILKHAKELNLNTNLVDTKDDWQEIDKLIKKEKPDVAVVAALGRLVPAKTLELLPNKFINIHPSLLPKLRGPAPIEGAILNNDNETGVSFIILTNKMDAGPIISQYKAEIDGLYANELSEKLSKIAAKNIVSDTKKYLAGEIEPVEQNELQATYTHIITKDEGQVNLDGNPRDIYAKIRAYTPWPGTFTVIDDTKLKIIEAHMNGNNLVIDKIQPAGKRIMTGKDFANGYKIILTKLPENVNINLL